MAVVSVPGTIPANGDQLYVTGVDVVETTAVTVGFEQVIDNELADKVVTGIAKSGMTLTVFCVNDELHPFAVVVTTTVNIPLPFVVGLETVDEFRDPEPGAVQL